MLLVGVLQFYRAYVSKGVLFIKNVMAMTAPRLKMKVR